MGSFANTLFTILLGWLQGAVSAVWNAFTSENGNSFLTWIGKNWILIAGILCVIGLAADLCVYLLRWKPFKVWKSFLFRNREQEENDTAGEEKPAPRRIIPEKQQRVITTAEQERPATPVKYEEPDLSQWKDETGQPAPRQNEPAEQPALVTGAGYVVPADSPYRRPAAQENKARRRTQAETDRVYRRTAERDIGPYHAEQALEKAEREESYSGRQAQPSERTQISREESVQASYPEIRRGREEPAQIVFRKRRRISVSDLFSDPEEELREIDAPQDIIDRNKAYREPVYPRGWKQNEDNRE